LFLEVEKCPVKPWVPVCALNFILLVVVGSKLRNVWLLSSEVLTVKAVRVCLWKCLCGFIAVVISATEVCPV